MEATDSRLTKKDVILLMLLVLISGGIRLYFVQFHDVVSADGISYITIAKDFISGKGLASATHYPPFYPILLGFASILFGDFETAGLAVSLVMGSLLVIPTFLLGTTFFNKKAGLIAAILVVAWPSLRFWSNNVMSQATYITMLHFGVYFLWRGYKNSSFMNSIVAGAFFACAHLTRSEGVIVLLAGTLVLVTSTIINRHSYRRLWYVLLSLGIFFVLFSPYMIILHDLTGKWQLTGKSKIAIADALSEYLGKPDIKHDPSFAEIGYLDLFRLYPDYVYSNYFKNIRACWNEMLPIYGWIIAAAGFIVGIKSREKIVERAYILSTFLPLAVIIVFFFIGPEYTQPYLPVLFLCIGNGIVALLQRLVPPQEADVSNHYAKYAWSFVLVAVILYAGWNITMQIPADRNKPYHYTKDGGRFDDKMIGLRLNKVLPEGATIMTRSGRIGFYSQRPYMIPPQADYSGIIRYAKENKVKYIIATIVMLNVRPQLEFLYDPILKPWKPFTPPPELELLNVAQEPGGLPYLIYKVK